MEELNLTFKESWLQDEPTILDEYCNEYKLKVLKDLGESWDWIENEEGVPEWTKVHKYKIEKL